MEPSISIYSFSLYTALPLMLFFGFYFLFAKTPEKKIFKNYLRSRQIMGIAMLLLSANYSVHFFFGIRFKNAAHPTNPVEGCADANPKTMLPNDT